MSGLEEKLLHGMSYIKLTDVLGRWQADILESYLNSEGIDAVLFQDTMSYVTLTPAFAEVQIYVPKASIKQARALLQKFNDEPEEEK